jgi:hypothetical protein
MPVTLADLRSFVFDLLGRPVLTDPNGVDQTQAIITRAINEALRHIQRIAPARVLEKSVTLNFAAGQQSVALPSDYREVITVVLAGKPLLRGDFELMVKAFGTSQGAPTNYSILGTNLYLFPTPNVATSVSFFYRAWLPDLVNDTDSNWYTDNATDYVRFKAAGIVARRLVAPDEVQLFESLAEDALRAVQTVIIAEQTADAPRTMRTVGTPAQPAPPPAAAAAG